jgi:predicted nucleotidyltransferase
MGDLTIDQTVQRIVTAIADLPGVAAIALGGSLAAGFADQSSDIDVYVYYREPLAATAERTTRLRLLADEGMVEVGIPTFGLEDHLHVQQKLVELVYLDLDRLITEADRAYSQGLINEGYSTALLYILFRNQVFHDATGEVTALHRRLQAKYPEPTRTRLLGAHPKLLRYFLELLRVSQRRDDLLYVQQLRYIIQAVYFDLLFALNRQYHPGGKRLLAHAQRCVVQPSGLAARWNDIALLSAADRALADRLEEQIDDLLRLIEADQ